ncbi:type I-B CRISPR-associated protein Cas5 [Pyrococcus furiosus DSM 3638]|uniref:Type I-B CRISPR-associated protein Cas5 n=2 Tax=Pyrococcus furiosus TaxID=2261 RepID=A0A5C0XNL2_PYRFU|nr:MULTISPECIES: type I-B CRISPR-associated protein Cas5b [Pyrococcus]AFN03912.1 hypothetical protein PFC_04825 [Pyrococcus furiosus COM1]MDK2869866.1 CRISPR-associated protein Cas5t [Pyrococcus sp.]QEK78776.1 type I-B CRISPR-associated protein Cas5 [Pyrococcus furiosus DSM 3638]
MIRVKLKSWTASFRYPTFQAGNQPTLPVPPPSTIQGILSAAKGEPVYLSELPYVGYVFKSEGRGVDLERIYSLSKEETDVIAREVLYNAELNLYLPDEWERYFRKPRYQLLLGRSSDLATVEEIKKVELEEKKAPIGGTVVPIDLGIPGIVHALVVEYDYSTIPRKPRLIKPFVILPFPRNMGERKRQTAKALYDPDLDIGVYLHRWRP